MNSRDNPRTLPLLFPIFSKRMTRKVGANPIEDTILERIMNRPYQFPRIQKEEGYFIALSSCVMKTYLRFFINSTMAAQAATIVTPYNPAFIFNPVFVPLEPLGVLVVLFVFNVFVIVEPSTLEV